MDENTSCMTYTFGVRMSDWMSDSLQELADRDRRTKGYIVRLILEEALENCGYAKPVNHDCLRRRERG